MIGIHNRAYKDIQKIGKYVVKLENQKKFLKEVSKIYPGGCE
jgi:hypothetical protein